MFVTNTNERRISREEGDDKQTRTSYAVVQTRHERKGTSAYQTDKFLGS